jgi:predicted nuclease with RNAse H fold/alkylated DNA nucleotide flippase Atl1
MARWIGVDVGGKRKGFDVAVVDERGLRALLGGFGREAVVELVDAERPAVVGIDSPRSCAATGRTARDGERLLARRICGIRWTPDRATVEGNPYYAWIIEGLGLFEALTDRGAQLIEVFPTASWTRWFGPRGAMSRAVWTEHGVVRLGLDGIPPRTNQDQRDAIAAAITAREHSEGNTEALGEIVVPTARLASRRPIVSPTNGRTGMETPPPARDLFSPPRTRRVRAHSRQGPSLDFQRAAAFIAGIPTGRWAAYKDVATAAGNEDAAQAVGDWVRRNGDHLPRVYRVLRIDGLVAEGYRPAGADLPSDGAAVRDVLQREGVLIDADGRAIRRQRFTAEDWRRAGAGPAEP